MKKSSVFLLVLAVVLAALLTGCSAVTVVTTEQEVSDTYGGDATPDTASEPQTPVTVAPAEQSSAKTGLEGTTWTGYVALTDVAVTFDSNGRYSSDHFGSGSYSLDGNQVSLVPGSGPTRVFVVSGSVMQGVVDGWDCTLTKQGGGGGVVQAPSGGDTGGLEGTTWTGYVALTEVTVRFDAGGSYSSTHFGSGSYSVQGNQVSLTPGDGTTRVFVFEGSLMQGVVDGWSCTLTKQ